MGAHDSVEQQQPIPRNEDFLSALGYGCAPSSLARYQSATFSSAAQDRRFSCMQSPGRPPTVTDVPPSFRVSSNRHKYAAVGPDILCSRCKFGSKLDISCAQHNCIDGSPDGSYNHNIASDIVSNPDVQDRFARPHAMSPYNEIAPPDFSPSRRSGSESIAGNAFPVPLVKHRSAAQYKAVGEDFHFKEATSLPSYDKPRASMLEGKALIVVSSDADVLLSPVRVTQDRRQLPGHRASFDGGIWPASNIKLSACTRFQSSSQGDKPSTQTEEKGIHKKTRSPIHTNNLQHNISTSHQCEVLEQDKMAISSKPLTLREALGRPMGCNSPGHARNTTLLNKQGTNESNHEVTHAGNPPSKSERMEKLKTRSMNSHERERAKTTSLGKHLGEHFQIWNTSPIHQLVKSSDGDGRKPGKPRKKNEVEISSATPDTREQGENVKPIENLNSMLEYKLHSILEVPAPKGTFPTVKKTPSSTSLRQAVASLLTPNRHKNQSSQKEDKSRGPLIGLSRSVSHSAWSSFSPAGASAKVVRSVSMDGREASMPPRGLKGGLLRNKNLPATERSCRSYDGIDSIDSSGCIMSDTESSSSGGSMPRPRQLSSRSLLTEGDVATSPASFSRRFARQSSEVNGDIKAASQRRLSLTMPALVRDATGRSRRLDAVDLAILNNRYLQWRFLNTSMKVATQSQESVAESLLFNACLSLFQLRTSVATKQMALTNAGLDSKLLTIIDNLSGALEKWDMVQEEYLSSINKVVSALETAVVNVPLHGVHVSTHSLKTALNCGVTIMEDMDPPIAKLQQQAEIVDPLLFELAEIVMLEKRYLEELSEIRASFSSLEMEERCLQVSLIQKANFNTY